MRIARHRGWTVIVALLVALPVVGCGNMGEENAALATSAIKASDARLKIIRTSNLVASAGAASVKLDGREVASLGIGGLTMLDIPAGAHKIVVGHWDHLNVYTMALDAKPGMLYTLEVSPRMEAAFAGATFGLIGAAVEAAANENGGAYEIRVVDAVAIKRWEFLGRQAMKARMAAATSSGLSSSAKWPAPGMSLVSGFARMALAIVPGIALGHQPVVLTPQDQGRRLDEGQAPFEPGVAQRPEDARGGLGGARLLDRPLDRVGAGRHLLELLVGVGLGRHEARDVVLLLGPRDQLRAPSRRTGRRERSAPAA